tara:strand:- start:622 stop:1314 length:693 start_codon:yes stop_codon:yes gene_type:complete
MKKNYTLLVMALMGLIITSAKSEDKWITLFNGKKVTGLRGYGQKGFPEKAWKVEAGTLKTITRGQGGQPRDLVTVGSFTDFEFECEWKVSPRGNSGIMYRVKETNRPAYVTGPEMQVLDDERHPDGKSNFPLRTAGSLYDMIGKGMKDKKYNKAGQWNKVRIVCKDNNVEHWMNGEKLLAYKWGSDEVAAMIKKSKFKTWKGFMQEPKGHIAIQHHGEEVWYRNIRVRGK